MGARGIALVVVLWALALLGTIAMSFAAVMRTEAQAARNGADAVRAYFQARTGINRTIAMLSWMPADNVLRAGIAAEDEDAGYEVAVESESGKIDVNRAPEGLLKSALKNALKNSGLFEDEAESLGNAILDRGEGGSRPRGAMALDELRFVMGVSPALYRDILGRIFTVHGRSPQVNVNAAPAVVLKALGLGPDAADGVVARRRETPFRSIPEVVAFLGAEGVPASALPYMATGSASNVCTITARGFAGGRVSRTVRCRVEVGGAGKPGVRIVQWEDLAAPAEDVR